MGGKPRKPQAKAFVQAYIENGRNATQAYMTIKPHVTKKTAQGEGSRYLASPEVKAELARLNKKTETSACLTLEEMKAKLSAMINGEKIYGQEIRNRDGLRAMRQLADIMSWGGVQKQELTVKGELSIAAKLSAAIERADSDK